MIFRQLFDGTSSTYSYLIASRVGGEAVILDPVLEKVDRYCTLLRELDLKQKINSDFYQERESYERKAIVDDVIPTLATCDVEEMENESPVDAEDEIENSLVTNNIFNNSYFMTFMQAL